MEAAKIEAQIEYLKRTIGECEEHQLPNLADHGRKLLEDAETKLKKETLEVR